jgi:ABC-type branched-subunit amino acid transport system permease subunit
MAIREDETAASAMGVDRTRTKLLAFAIGAAFAGATGTCYVAKLQTATPEMFGFPVSVMILVMVVLGGLGSVLGRGDRRRLAAIAAIVVSGGHLRLDPQSNLSGANLTGANLSGTDLRGTNVIQRQLDGACGSGTKLPAGLRIQPCPTSNPAIRKSWFEGLW